MAELVDAQASGACGSNVVWVQVPSSALGTNRIFAEEAVVSSANCLEGQESFETVSSEPQLHTRECRNW